MSFAKSPIPTPKSVRTQQTSPGGLYRDAEPVLDAALPAPECSAVGAGLAPPAPGKACMTRTLSFRAKRGICFSLVSLPFFVFVAQPQTAPQRLHIFGIAGVTVYVSRADDARKFYEGALGPQEPSKHPKKHCFWCEKPPNLISNFDPNGFQSLSTDPAPSPAPACLIEDIAFHTDNVMALRDLLAANKIDFWAPSVAKPKYLSLTDPEGHRIFFLETDGALRDPNNIAVMTKGGYKNEIIHAGFIVRDRAATEHFYKDILGFRPYWHGGMKDDGKDDWVSLQVPDGTDWIEMMVNVSPDADQRVRGIMNHIAIGVTDIHATEQRLKDAGVKLTEEPKIGRDGKWQLNVYDPDLTRVEFMEFQPVQKPCCSEFTGPHPGPNL